MVINEIYLDHDAFVAELNERYDKATEIAKCLDYIEGCFVLAATDNAKVYVMEVSHEYDEEAVSTLVKQLLMSDIPVSIVPAKCLSYVGTVTAKSLGFVDKIKKLRDDVKKIFRGE